MKPLGMYQCVAVFSIILGSWFSPARVTAAGVRAEGGPVQAGGTWITRQAAGAASSMPVILVKAGNRTGQVPEAGHGWTVCIDPGHPSEVGRGTRGRKITEIQAAWDVALKMQSLLQQEGVNVVLTKQSPGQMVRNRERAEIANRAGANLMVRLHCDAGSGSGTATYFPDRQGEKDGVRGPSREIITSSRAAAHRFHTAMMKSLRGVLPNLGVHPDIDTQVGSGQGALTGSIFSKVPVLLVEMCVLTNPRDDTFMASQQGQWQMAKALSAGVNAVLAPGGTD